MTFTQAPGSGSQESTAPTLADKIKAIDDQIEEAHMTFDDALVAKLQAEKAGLELQEKAKQEEDASKPQSVAEVVKEGDLVKLAELDDRFAVDQKSSTKAAVTEETPEFSYYNAQVALDNDITDALREKERAIKARREEEVGNVFREVNGGMDDRYTNVNQRKLVKNIISLFQKSAMGENGTATKWEEYKNAINEKASLVKEPKTRDALLELVNSPNNLVAALAKGPITTEQRSRAERDIVDRLIASAKAEGEDTPEEFAIRVSKIKNKERERYDNLVRVRADTLREADTVLEKISSFDSSDFTP